MAHIQTSLPVPTQPWEAAKRRFLDGLSPVEIQRFQDATLENLFYDASGSQKRHAQGSSGWVMQERLTGLIEGINDYAQALDVYSNTWGLILCPIWGSLRVILHIASEASKFQGKLVDMLAHIGDVLPRFRIYEKLFRNHERLLIKLSESYLDVLRFCVRVKDFFVHARKSLIPLSVLLRGAWKPFRLEFEADMVNFREHEKSIEKEASLAHMIESAKVRAVELAKHALKTQTAKSKRRHKLLSALPTVDYRTKHAKLSALRHPGTNSWIHSNAEVTAWLSSPTSDCLTCYGIPGSGKSILAARITDHLATSVDASSVLCYFYCDYADISSLDPMYLIASLIKQVLVRLPLDYFNEDLSCPFDDEGPLPTLRASVDFFSQICSSFKTAFVLIDGMDELAEAGYHATLEVLEHILQWPKVTAKIFVTSRTEEYHIRNTFQAYRSINLSVEQINDDIEHFIKSVVNAAPTKWNPLLKNERLKLQVIDALIAGAQGMFLWVTFQLHDIGNALSEADIQQIIADLPPNLNRTYLRIIQKAYDSGGQQRVALMEKVFSWIACARRPLHIEELEEAVGLETTDTYLHTERIAPNAGERLISMCSNLVIYHQEDRTVSFAHHTVQQFMCSRTLPGFDERYPRPIQLDLHCADHEIGEICISYLAFSDFETQVATRATPPSVARRDIEYLIWGGVPIGTHLQKLISWLHLQRNSSENRSTFQISVMPSASTMPSATLAMKYKLLDYVVEFWPDHATRFTTSSSCWSAFRKTVFDRQLLFEHRPWNEETHQVKVNLVLDKLQPLPPTPRLWASRTIPGPLFNPKDIEALYLYAWAISQGLVSFLALVGKDSLEKYIKASFGDLRGGDVTSLVNKLISSTSAQGGDFWSGKFMSSLLQELGEDVDKSGELGASRFSSKSCRILLDILRIECLLWVDGDGSCFHHTLDEVLGPHQTFHHDELYRFLIKYHIKKDDQRARHIISAVKDGKTHLVKTLLDDPDSVRLFTGHENLEIETTRPRSAEMQLDLLFAFQACLMDLILWANVSPWDMRYMNEHNAWLLLALASTEYKHFGLARDLLLRMSSRDLCHSKFVLPMHDWRYTRLGTEEAYQRLERLSGENVVAIAFSTLRAHFPCNDPYSEGYRFMELLVEQCVFDFIPADYESRGIHCLNWLIDWKMWKSVNRLIQPYTRYVADPRNKGAALILLKDAIIGKEQLELVHSLLWASCVVEECLADPLFSQHIPDREVERETSRSTYQGPGLERLRLVRQRG